MNFDDYMRRARELDEISIDSTWSQGRTIFGGITAAILLEKMSQKVENDKSIKSLSIIFSAPLRVETPCQLYAEKLSSGKSASQLQSKISQNDQICGTAVATFGRSRDSRIIHKAENPKNLMISDQKKISYIEKITPVFLQHFELCLVEGSYPYSGNESQHQGGWANFKETPEDISPAHLLALTDAWPPTTLQNYKRPGPGSTVHWNVNFLDASALSNPIQDKVYFSSSIVAAQQGYAQTEARIYSQQGELVLTSTQLVMVYE